MYSTEAPLISVIIPCYKQAHFLNDAIDSVLAQRYPHIEIIVIDDGSPDHTAEVATHYRDVHYIRQNNQGLSGARNTGIHASRGEYLVFLDADDRLTPDALQCSLDCFVANQECAFVSGHHRYIDKGGSLLNEYPPEPIDIDPYCALLKRNYIGMHATVMYRRSVFEKIGYFDTTLKSCEDYDLYIRIARLFPVFRHNHIVAEYRWHGANMSSNGGRMLRTALTVLRSQQAYIQDKPHYLAACKEGSRFWRRYFLKDISTKLLVDIKQTQWVKVAKDVLILVQCLFPWLISLWMEINLYIALVRQKRIISVTRG